MADTAKKLTATAPVTLAVAQRAPKAYKILQTRKAQQAEAVFPQRPPVAVTCPHCWQEQRALRDSCWRCGARFIYESES